MKRTRTSPRPLPVLAACLAALLALAPCALDAKPAKAPGKKAAKKAGRVEAPPPDPLADAWPSRESPQLGNGTLRSEVLVAARRVAGLSNSLDEDGFVGHLAYVLDLARKDDQPSGGWARAVVRRAVARGLLKKDPKARPGDLVAFSLDPARPGSAKASRLLVGVVESAGSGVVRFIAPIGNTVSRGVARPGKKPGKDDTAIRECRAPEPPKATLAPKGKKKGKAKPPKPPRALPCRAGQMWIGRIPAEALERVF